MLAANLFNYWRNFLSLGLFACTFVHPIAPQTSQPDLDGTKRNEIARVLAKQVKAQHLAGMAAIVFRADSVLGIAAAGVRKEGEHTRIQTDDLFHLGSNGKAITATVIARLIEAGRMSFTTTPADAFPELKNAIHPGFKTTTIEQFLSHHAGVPPYTSDKEFKTVPTLIGNEVEQRAKFAAWVLQHPPAVPAGTNGLYSNAGYAIAAAMAERMTGLSWEALVKSEILQPLGINAIFGYPTTDDKNQPWNHVETKDGVKAIGQDEAWQVPPYLRPAGDISMSLSDYGRFLQMNLKALRGTETTFLSVATARRLHSSPSQDEYALGWGTSQLDGVRSSTHAGSGGSFYAIVTLRATRDEGVAVVANSAGERTAHACENALDALLARYATAHPNKGK